MRRLPFALLLLSVSLAFGQSPPQRMGSEPLDPVREARAQALGKSLRCAVCQGLSITDSPSSMARAQLDKVRELIVAGKSDDEITDYFVARYGEWVLLEPTKGGMNALVWVSPGILLVVGFIIILGQVRRRPKAGAVAKAAAPTPAADGDDEYLKAVRAELEK
jgi:cytochrome c-type biogenesis protein CcmH